MLRSKYSKESEKKFRAIKVFTDRDEPRKIFRDSVYNFYNDENRSEMLIFYGHGGIGKTTLLKELFIKVDELCSRSKNDTTVAKIYVSLEAYDYNNPVNVLTSIRSQLKIDCGLFDYALLQYSAKTKHTVDDFSRKIVGFNGPLLDIMNEALTLGMGSASVPANVLKKSAEIIKDIYIKKKYKEEIDSIKDLNEFEIYQRLPHYLGICISEAAKKGKKHIFFLDSYESLLIRTTNSALVEDSEEWLKEFFLSSENLLLVIACREKFKWYEDDLEWNEYLNQHILERLVYEDSIYFLNQVPIKDDNVKNAIAELAQGVPLYLDMCVDIYEDAINSSGVVSENLFNITGNKIIGRYMRHLNDKEKVAIKILSVVNFFSMELAEYLLKSQNLYFSDEEILRLFNKSVFVEIDEQQEIFKVDESVRNHVLSSMETEKKQLVILNMICFVKDMLKTELKSAYVYFEQIFKIIIRDSSQFVQQLDEMIGILYLLIDMGYWCEIHNMVQSYISSDDIYIRSYCLFAELFYLRRTSRLDKAQEIIDQNKIVPDALGSYRYLYEFLKTHILHLSGKYDQAIQQYKLLVEHTNLIKENMDVHLVNTINIKYIDVLFLKGNFKTALKMIDELIDRNTVNIIDKAEILRVKGHIYRFNFRLEEAALIYKSALKLFSSEKCASLEGKIYNNLTEVYCLCDPETALEYAIKSIDINEHIDSKIELGKTYAAASVAYSLLNRLEEANDYAYRSIEIQKGIGYVSGELFGEVALFIVKFFSNEGEKLQDILQRINEIIEKINVYHFLKLPIFLMVNNEMSVQELKLKGEWLDFEATLNAISEIFMERR